MKKTFYIIWDIVQIFIIVYVVLITAFMFFSNKYGYTEFGKYVLKNDNNGDLLIIKKSSDIKEGDNIYYYSVVKEKYAIEKDIVKRVNEKDYEISNNFVSKSKVIGKSSRKIVLLGKILNRLESKVGFLVFVLLPMLVVFLYQVYDFIVSISNKRREE